MEGQNFAIFEDSEVDFGAEFIHWYMPWLCYKIVVNHHNFGHPNVWDSNGSSPSVTKLMAFKVFEGQFLNFTHF